jgi:hypothetical protein
MQWEILIIPLIALGVWILGTLFKTGEDEQTKKGGRKPGGPSGRGPSRRPVTDLDRFLDDARRRRETEERRGKPALPPPPPQPVIVRAPLSERPPRPREAPPRSKPPVRREEVPVAIPIARIVAEPALPEAVLVEPRGHLSAEPPVIAPKSTRDTRISPIVQQVRALLSKPQTAGAAFVLREILDRPRCMRRH